MVARRACLAGGARRRRDRAGGGADRPHRGWSATATPRRSPTAPTPTATRSSAWSRCCGDARREPTARWLHRGLTSQDVIDTALMLCVRDVLVAHRRRTRRQVRALAGLAEAHSDTPMLARTLTQAALPSTVGAKVANWLSRRSRRRRPACGASRPAARAGRRRGRNTGRRNRTDRSADARDSP